MFWQDVPVILAANALKPSSVRLPLYGKMGISLFMRNLTVGYPLTPKRVESFLFAVASTTPKERPSHTKLPVPKKYSLTYFHHAV